MLYSPVDACERCGPLIGARWKLQGKGKWETVMGALAGREGAPFLIEAISVAQQIVRMNA